VAALRARRAGSEAEPSADAESAVEVDLATFWNVPKTSDEVALHFALPESDALPIKGLGPPAFVRDPAARAAMTAAMERLYEQIGAYALLLALGDPEPGPRAETSRIEP
jgi:hypothetical protein